MSYLTLSNISLRYKNANQLAVDNVSLSLEEGKLLVLAGASGSGKSSLLRTIAGLEQPQKGHITIGSTTLFSKEKSLPPNKRKVGMVFQDYALFPHLTVAKNIGYGLTKSEQKKEKITTALALVGLEGYENRYPHQLSGGEQQRVAIARAIAPKPLVLLLDEPFSNLDENLKDEVRKEIKQIVKESGITTILVTHDTRDALSVADEIAVLKNGFLQQIASATTIYQQPKNAYVARFFDKVNIIEGTAENIKLLNLPAEYEKREMMIRPQNIELLTQEKGIIGVLKRKEYLGNRYLLEVEVSNKLNLVIYSEHCEAAIEGKVAFQIKTSSIHFLG